jgi:hypothetical protein
MTYDRSQLIRYRTWDKVVYEPEAMAMRAYNTPFERGGARAMDARRANDRIAEKAKQLRFVSRVPMICECTDPACRTIVMIGLSDYDAIRRDDGTFLTAPGHEVEGAVLEAQTAEYEVNRAVDCRRDGDGDRRSA